MKKVLLPIIFKDKKHTISVSTNTGTNLMRAKDGNRGPDLTEQ